jgi:hypothetical protein
MEGLESIVVGIYAMGGKSTAQAQKLVTEKLIDGYAEQLRDYFNRAILAGMKVTPPSAPVDLTDDNALSYTIGREGTDYTRKVTYDLATGRWEVK